MLVVSTRNEPPTTSLFRRCWRLFMRVVGYICQVLCVLSENLDGVGSGISDERTTTTITDESNGTLRHKVRVRVKCNLEISNIAKGVKGAEVTQRKCRMSGSNTRCKTRCKLIQGNRAAKESPRASAPAAAERAGWKRGRPVVSTTPNRDVRVEFITNVELGIYAGSIDP